MRSFDQSIMDAEWRSDQQDMVRMRALSHQIDAFLSNPPSRVDDQIRVALEEARRELGRKVAHIVAVWD